MSYRSGRHFLQIPGPSNVPDRVLRAIDRATMDHRGPEFGAFTLSILERLKTVFKTEGPVITYPSSGTGAWEAALVNTLSLGDRVLMFETGQFAILWQELAGRLGLDVDMVEGDWRHGVSAGGVESRLYEDKDHAIKADCVVHNETSTGVVSNVAAVRAAAWYRLLAAKAQTATTAVTGGHVDVDFVDEHAVKTEGVGRTTRRVAIR